MAILRILALDDSSDIGESSKVHHSYQCLIDGKARYLCDYYARANIVKETEIIDLKDAHQSLHIKQTEKAKKQVVEISNSEHSQVWHFDQDQLTNDEGEIIARLKPSELHNLEKSSSEPGRFDIKNSRNSILLASLFEPPHSQGSALHKMFQSISHPLSKHEREVYRIKINRWGGNMGLVLAMALVKFHDLH